MRHMSCDGQWNWEMELGNEMEWAMESVRVMELASGLFIAKEDERRKTGEKRKSIYLECLNRFFHHPLLKVPVDLLFTSSHQRG